MSNLVYLNEDGRGNIYDESGVQAMDIVDEEGDSFAIKQLMNFNTYLERNPAKSDNEGDQETEMIEAPVKNAILL